MINTPKGFFGKGQLLCNLDPKTGRLVANATTLRHDEQKQYDSAMVSIARKRLRLANLFRAKGLIRPLGGLGTILSMYERSGDFSAANVSMDGFTRGEGDRLTFDEVGVPIPIFHKEFSLQERQLLASRGSGNASNLDTSSIELATRVVTDEIETHMYYGESGIVVAGNTVYGLGSHPNRNTGNVTASWASATGAQIVTDVKAMLDAMYADNFFGPFILCVAKNIWANIQQDYSTAKGDNTIMDRILAFVDIDDVVPGDYLNDGEVIMFNADTETVDLAIAQDMDNVPWQNHPMLTEYMVFAAMAIRVKADKAGKCGVVHYTEA